MKEMLAVFIGGGFGSLARYGLIKSISLGAGLFPVATFAANLLSCLIVGILVALIERKILISPFLSHLLIIGFCGGFSTFSTLTRESFIMLTTGKTWLFFLYNLVSIGSGLVFLLSGIWVGKFLIH